HTDSGVVEVGVAPGKARREQSSGNHRAADVALGRAVVANSPPATVDGRVPVRIPIVGVGATEAVGRGQLHAGTVDEHGVRHAADAEALISAGHAGTTTVHRVRGVHQVLEVVTACTVGVDALDIQHITRTGRNVLDRQSQGGSPAPLVR